MNACRDCACYDGRLCHLTPTFVQREPADWCVTGFRTKVIRLKAYLGPKTGPKKAPPVRRQG